MDHPRCLSVMLRFVGKSGMAEQFPGNFLGSGLVTLILIHGLPKSYSARVQDSRRQAKWLAPHRLSLEKLSLQNSGSAPPTCWIPHLFTQGMKKDKEKKKTTIV
jgi:hypothetical protein